MRRKIIKATLLSTLFLFLSACTQTKPNLSLNEEKSHDVQLYTASNKDGKITPKSIETAFEQAGLSIVGNNDMNIPFKKRFGKTHYKVYNLAMFSNDELSYKLLKKYPSFGALTPLTMSIYAKGNTINIATLTLEGMARTTKIPKDDRDLIAYSKLITKALTQALPHATKKLLGKSPEPKSALQVNFTAPVVLEDGKTSEEFIEDFEAEFEAEMEPLGFLFPNFTNINEELFEEHGYEAYDFYHTYSICKFDVIYPVSKLHPQAGAWAPCSFYLYKKKGENTMYMGFLSVENWIETLDIQDKESIKPLKDAQNMIIEILKELSAQERK